MYLYLCLLFQEIPQAHGKVAGVIVLVIVLQMFRPLRLQLYVIVFEHVQIRIHARIRKYKYMHVFVFVSSISRNIYLSPGKVAGVIVGWSLLDVFSHHVFPLPDQCGHLCL